MTSAMGTVAGPTPGADDRAVGDAPAWKRIVGANGMWVLGLNLVLIAGFSLLSTNHVFWSTRNLSAQLLNGSTGLILALAMTILLGGGLFDLSVGVNLVMSSVVGVIAMVNVAGGKVQALGGGRGPVGAGDATLGIAAGLVACLVTGMAFGLANGVIIGYLRVNSFIATLGTFSVATGVVLIITDGSDLSGLPAQLQENFGYARFFDWLPYPFVVAIALAALVWAVIRYTRFGLYTLAIGSSQVAALRGGVRVKLHIVKLCTAAGALCGLAGFLSLAQYGATTVSGHGNDALTAITAVVIGGNALAGGHVSVIGTVWGVMLAGILLGGLVIAGVSAFYQLVAIGGILIIAVAVDRYRNRRSDAT